MKIQISRIDENGFYIEPVLVDEDRLEIELYDTLIEEDGTETKIKKPYLCEIQVPEGLHLPKWDKTNEVWVEGKTTDELLKRKRLAKIEEIYQAYQSEKLGDVTSSLVGADSLPIVFEYAENNQQDYTKIGTKFALNSTLTDSIIGSKSHGKFYITREDFTTLTNDFDAHETNLYLKFKDLKEQAEFATIDTIDKIVW